MNENRIEFSFLISSAMLFPRKFVVLIAFYIFVPVNCSVEEEEHGVIYANRCEACKILAIELEAKLQETGKSHDVIEVGYAKNA